MTDECRHKLQILKDTCHAYCEICGEWEAEIQQKRIAALEVERDELKSRIAIARSLVFEKWDNPRFNQHCARIYAALTARLKAPGGCGGGRDG